MNKIFIHGMESSSRGGKANWFRARYPDMMINDYRGSLDERSMQLERDLSGRDDLVLVGSSFGGLMATVFAYSNQDRIRRMVLLAPALNFAGIESYSPAVKLEMETIVYIGAGDTVTPLQEVGPLARRIFARLDLRVVDDDHLLRATFASIPWQDLLD